MSHARLLCTLLPSAVLALWAVLTNAENPSPPAPLPADGERAEGFGTGSNTPAESSSSKVYGEWRIRIRPDKGAEYNQLIEQKGLPLFRAAGGRMVGWWTTLMGDLYEHVTIWEYDDMAAFEKAIQFLGKEERFAQFVAQRDPLLTGEESRFLKLTAGAEKPLLPDTAKFVIHEIHRVPLKQQAEYVRFMEQQGLPLLKKHGFRPVGPWVVAVGRWTEVTYLFRFESLAEREQLIAQFTAHQDAQTYVTATNKFVDEITTRLLLPAPFVATGQPAHRPKESSRLPHLQEIAPDVFAVGFAHRHASANCGWVATRDETVLIDLPRGIEGQEFLSAAATTGKSVRRLVLTQFHNEDVPIVESLLAQGVEQIVTSAGIGKALLAASNKIATEQVQSVSERLRIGNPDDRIEFMPLDGIVGTGGAAVYLAKHGVLFAGPFVVNGPRSSLPGCDTARWVSSLWQLEAVGANRVVPGFGSWGGPEILVRQRRFLAELRRQVGYVIAQGRPEESLRDEIRIPSDYLVWMPYDTPTAEDVEHVYRELTVPFAPFNGHVPDKSDPRAHALVLIADLPHEPGHIEQGLVPVFEATGVVPHFAVDVHALSAENLGHVQLLVILRDGLQRPKTAEKSEYVWMTPEQQRAVVEFVEHGGAFLNLHNAMGLYPAGGPYLNLVGGRYTGHGPLERFRVEVVDRSHPITRGVADFSVADEQHTPEFEAAKVQLLLRNRSDDGRVAAAGWVHEPGRGRLCHLANGHTRESLLNSEYQRLLRNAVNWCLRRD